MGPMAALPPLPTEAAASAVLLAWRVFDDATGEWVVAGAESEPGPAPGPGSTPDAMPGSDAGVETDEARAERSSPGKDPSSLTLLTWNIDAFNTEPAARMSAILNLVRARAAAAAAASPDIIFFQETSAAAMNTLLQDAWIRQGWYVSDVNMFRFSGSGARGEGHIFCNLTLVSRRFRLHQPGQSSQAGHQLPSKGDLYTLGAVWRVNFPSRFGRYALCCDVGVPVTASNKQQQRQQQQQIVRLVNVHLDSLPIRPSHRPRQLEMIANMLRYQGEQQKQQQQRPYGLVAGDFNPVIPEEDDGLVAANGLVDVWPYFHPPPPLGPADSPPGFTWGVDGKREYPPARLDKVAVLGLKPHSIRIVHPGTVEQAKKEAATGETNAAAGTAAAADNNAVNKAASRHGNANGNSSNKGAYSGMQVPWSDHSGLWCTIGLPSADQGHD